MNFELSPHSGALCDSFIVHYVHYRNIYYLLALLHLCLVAAAPFPASDTVLECSTLWRILSLSPSLEPQRRFHRCFIPPREAPDSPPHGLHLRCRLHLCLRRLHPPSILAWSSSLCLSLQCWVPILALSIDISTMGTSMGTSLPTMNKSPSHFYHPLPYHCHPMHDYDFDSHDKYCQHDGFDRYSHHY